MANTTMRLLTRVVGANRARLQTLSRTPFQSWNRPVYNQLASRQGLPGGAFRTLSSGKDVPNPVEKVLDEPIERVIEDKVEVSNDFDVETFGFAYQLPAKKKPVRDAGVPKQKSLFKVAGRIMHELDTELAREAMESRRDKLPEFQPGDAVEVSYRFNKTAKGNPAVARGVVIAKRNRHINAGFKVLGAVDGHRVEYDFPLHCNMIENVRVLMPGFVNRFRNTKSKRAKLYYLRDLPLRRVTVTLENTGNASEAGSKKKKKKSKKKKGGR